MQLLGEKLRGISDDILRSFTEIQANKEILDVTGNNGFVLSYIVKTTEPLYQKDIEKKFSMTRSTASKVISAMEKKNLVRRQKVDLDGRLNQIVATEKGEHFIVVIDQIIEQFDMQLTKGFTEEELALFYSFIERVSNNLIEN